MSEGLFAETVSLSLGGKAVLNRVTAQFSRGELVAIVGPNGAGKSSLLSCLAGLRRPDTGQVSLDGAIVTQIPARRRARVMAFLAQTPEIAWDVDVRTFVGLGRTPHLGAFGPSAEDAAAMDQAIATTGLDDFVERPITRLSGGERARALIARALAGQTDWLLADEPLTGLDPGHALDTVGLFRRLAHEQGKGVIVTLHDLTLAARFADRVLLLDRGCLVADGAPGKALTPQALAMAYGVATRTHAGEAGPLIEILRRVD
ncbi:ABC transporter ATP-binding protein [Caulobacter segnis]|uniref:ABC transporter related protein n=1 Tax=Caulobacter segnis (strain ATCC 21756 / DSM 7131 / JCM 7823 / NBRC 15250 / LMG 17158 / TK0059) TaxID=509190 RepID=D5VGM4_CAUST|nr:ABC transporter ATP-binding protein [Caulobacter segnis]ADG10467.1 ABC transporter related protein [Caulobacter segnis ATCC 21756]